MLRTANQAAIELNQLLTKSKEKAPFILVGHSFGEFITIYFQKKLRELV